MLGNDRAATFGTTLMSTRIQIVKQSETPLRRTRIIIRDGHLMLHRAAGPLAPKWIPPSVGTELPVEPHLRWVLPDNIDDQSRLFSLPTESSLSHRSLIGADRQDIAALVNTFLTGLPHIRALPEENDSFEPTALQRLHQWWTADTLSEPAAKLRDYVTYLLTPADRDRVEQLITTKHSVRVLGSASCSELFPTTDSRSIHVLVDEVCVGPPDWEIGVLLGEQIEILAQVDPNSHSFEDPVVIALLEHSTTPRSHLGLIAGLRWLLHLHDYLTYVFYSDTILSQAAYACALISNED